MKPGNRNPKPETQNLFFGSPIDFQTLNAEATPNPQVAAKKAGKNPEAEKNFREALLLDPEWVHPTSYLPNFFTPDPWQISTVIS
jgi:hypothetical protein